MVAIQLKRLVCLIALCTLVSSSTIQPVQRADNLDNVGASQNAQNGSLSTPGKDSGPPAEIRLNIHQPNDGGDNHNSQADSRPPNRMNFISPSLSRRSVESTNKNPDDNKPNSDAGSGKPSTPHQPSVPVLGNTPIPRSIEKLDKSVGVDTPIPVHPDRIQDKRAAVENHAPDGSFHRTIQTKRVHTEGAPIGEAGINEKFQDGQQKTEGLSEQSSEPQMECLIPFC